MALDDATVEAFRADFVEKLDERDVTREALAIAKAAQDTSSKYRAAIEAIPTEWYLENEDIEPPTFPSQGYLEWLDGIVKKSDVAPSPELSAMRSKLQNWLNVAEDVGLSEATTKAIGEALQRYNASTGTTPRAGNGGGGKSAKTRELKQSVKIVWRNENGVENTIEAGGRTGEGDWVSARYQMKTKVDAASGRTGRDPNAVWNAFKGQLDGVASNLLNVDAGNAQAFTR